MTELTLKSNRLSGEGMHHITFDGGDYASLYQHVGQYATLDSNGERGYFAFANAPGSTDVEFLVKRQGEPATSICDLAKGDRIIAGMPEGTGFVNQSDSNLHHHLFSMGSGLAPLRGIVQMYSRGEWPCASLTVWQSSFSKDHLPFADEYSAWESTGVTVVPCLDREGPGYTGNVIARLAEANARFEDAMCFWIGSPGFGEALRLELLKRGLPSDHFHTNV